MHELFIAISVRIIQAILLLWSNENEKKTDKPRIKDSPKKKSSSETKLKKTAEHVEPNAPVASPVQTVEILTTMETPQGVGI